ncbi:cytochrome P450 4C1-like isoform X1 [Linepithema humile]|uniref:cytochrome P450 4C1-like isoform X1 n=1 Tax=Linepithema humile TaxID=83485 RepID=UPI00351ECC1A
MVITLLLLCIFLILLCHYLIHHGRFWKLIDQIPGPPPLLIIGNVLLIGTCPVEEQLKTLEKYLKIYYPVAKLWIFNHAGVSASHPDDVQTILSNSKEHIGKGFVYTFLNPWLGTGLLTSEGTKWHERRKMLTPAFHFNMLKQFVDIFIEEGNYMTQCLKDIEGSTVNDLIFFTSHHTLNVICETAMGISLKDMGAFQQQYRKTVYEITKLILARLMSPWFYSDMIFALSPMGKRQAKNLKILHGFTEKIIAERKQYHKSTNGQYLKQFENNSVNNNEEIIGIRRKRLAMLDLLIAASRNNKMSDLDIREEVDTFVLGGYETTAISISFTILLLAEHKNIQNCVRREVSAVMLENNGKLTMTAINNMPYLERCLKESLRLYPSVPNIMRVASEDLKIQSYIVPSGAILYIPIKFIHRNPDFWPNPDVFDPDRFLPENIQNRHPFSYLPFSAGARNCIGQRFAMLELKAIIATLVHNFYLEPIDYLKDLRFRLDLVTRVADPIRVKFIPIEQMQPFKAN